MTAAAPATAAGCLLRHGRVYRTGACWTGKHQRWLGTQRFDDPQLQATFIHYRTGSR